MAKKLNWNQWNPWLDQTGKSTGQKLNNLEDVPCDRTGALEKGQLVKGVVSDVAFGGDGVMRCENQVVFVPHVITGETVEAKIVETKKSYAKAQLVKVIDPSPERIDPKCPIYGECGGCQYQHISYPNQLIIKEKQVRDIFERIGKLDGSKVRDVLPCPQPFNYRNRIMVRTQWNKAMKKMVVGFLRYHSRLVVPVEECHIAEYDLNKQLENVKKDHSRKNGVKYVLRKFPENWILPNDSFFQNNFFLLPGMVEEVKSCLKDFGGEYLVDTYCGVGFFALELASEVKEFKGVEIDRMAIKAANQNAKDKNITNGSFVEGPTEKILPELMKAYPPEQTTVVLDPPRRGIDPSAIEFLKSIGPGQILYISCHPATQARDLATFCSDGTYSVRLVKPMDMFPQTQHIECVADIRLNKQDT